ncbi:hypothetical protein FHR32_000845 [Streptosporangium album]|uniref:Uncharacterized protein n=1 Tax=Streptosporangium album TaxID=47479 RepID=A0A7W7W833_9ACTN|nr:hypothetical protein [Streptosporangium album]
MPGQLALGLKRASLLEGERMTTFPEMSEIVSGSGSGPVGVPEVDAEPSDDISNLPPLLRRPDPVSDPVSVSELRGARKSLLLNELVPSCPRRSEGVAWRC